MSAVLCLVTAVHVRTKPSVQTLDLLPICVHASLATLAIAVRPNGCRVMQDPALTMEDVSTWAIHLYAHVSHNIQVYYRAIVCVFPKQCCAISSEYSSDDETFMHLVITKLKRFVLVMWYELFATSQMETDL